MSHLPSSAAANNNYPMSAQLGPDYTQPGTGKFEGQLSQALTFNRQPPSVDGVSAGMLGGND